MSLIVIKYPSVLSTIDNSFYSLNTNVEINHRERGNNTEVIEIVFDLCDKIKDDFTFLETISKWTFPYLHNIEHYINSDFMWGEIIIDETSNIIRPIYINQKNENVTLTLVIKNTKTPQK